MIVRIKELVEIVKAIVEALLGSRASAEPRQAALPAAQALAPVADEQEPVQRADESLTEHFGLHEMTQTSNTALQEKNRLLTDGQAAKLRKVAELLEAVRSIVGAPISVHSGYRCEELNGATPGSATHSQHVLCEAADWSVTDAPATADGVENAFQKVWQAARAGQVEFGQLIVESAPRDYGRVFWIHVSLGKPYRDPARCGEVLRMVDGKYTLIGKVV